jgi:hypothetical protein
MYCTGLAGIVLIYGIFAVIVANEQVDTPTTVARAQQSLPRVGVFSESWSAAQDNRSGYEGRQFYRLSTEYLLYAHGFDIVHIPSVARTGAPARAPPDIDALLIDVKLDADVLKDSDNIVRSVYDDSVLENIPILALNRGAITLVRLMECDGCVVQIPNLQNYTTHARRVDGFFEDAADLLREPVLSFDSTLAVSTGSAMLKPLIECNDQSGQPFIAAFSARSTSNIFGVTFDLDARANLASSDLANFVMTHFASKASYDRARTNVLSHRTSVAGGRIVELEGKPVIISSVQN